ncbi:MAG: hypothetical protein K6G47_00580 [Clostridia bacterium]|nr:hypothetical protein [Clostridia bacterium]
MKRVALAMSVVLALCLLGACDRKTPKTTEAQAESVATTTTTTAATATPTPSPTPTPVPVPVFVKETYSVKDGDTKTLIAVEKTQADKVIYSASYFMSGSGIQSESAKEYDDKGKLISSVSTSTLKRDDYVTTKTYASYEYDEDGNLITVTEENYTVDPDTKEEIYDTSYIHMYQYNSDGSLSYAAYFNSEDNDLLSEETYRYDEKGMITEIVSMTGITAYSYDENGNVVEYEVSSEDSIVEIMYTYNGDHLVYEKEYISDKLCYETSYQYDDNGNMILMSETSYDLAHGGSDKSQNYYEYDEEGNLIKSGNADNPDSYTEYVYYFE